MATLIDDAPAGPVQVLGGDVLRAANRIAAGIRIALRDLAAGDAVVKYAVRIGHATGPIAAGDWVHLHNLASDLTSGRARWTCTRARRRTPRYE